MSKQKILGLDLGVSSIGYCLIEQSGAKINVLSTGVKIVPLSAAEKDEFSKGSAITTNQDRRKSRQARRGIQRYKQRRKNLCKVLLSSGMMPDENLIHTDKIELYALRSKAIKEQVSKVEVGRILLHLNQKRGYNSSRFTNQVEEGKKLTDYLSEISDRGKLIHEKGMTIGAYFYSILIANPNERLKGQIFHRDLYLEEFDKIWEVQSKFYPELDDILKEKIRNRIIYFQRPLKSQKGRLAMCTLEPGSPVSPKSSPWVQYVKVWEAVNNIHIEDKRKEEQSLKVEQKRLLADYLMQKEKLTFSEAAKMLKISTHDFHWNYKSEIKGNLTYVKLQKALKGTLSQEEEARFLHMDYTVPEQPKGQLYHIWHLIYSIENEEILRKSLLKIGIPEKCINALVALDFKSGGTSNKSSKACRKLIPFLEEGLMYSEAAEKAGYNHSHSITKEENLKRQLASELKIFKKGSLNSPVVEKILNRLIHVLNSIVKEHGHPDAIHIELARELQMNAEKRNALFKSNTEAEKKHKSIVEELEKIGYKRPNKSLIDKYKLYHETDGMSVYTGQRINRDMFFRGEGADVEHIIPKSRVFDNGFSNKVICETVVNREKGSLTAYDYMKGKSQAEFDQYIERLKMLLEGGKIKYTKWKNLMTPVDKIPQDFIDRQLRETQHIVRRAKELCEKICYEVISTSGTVTDHLKHLWGLDWVLHDLQFEQYEKELRENDWLENKKIHDGKIKEVIKGWNKRVDHRHHAIDAFVIALTQRAHIQKLNTLNAKFGSLEQTKERAWQIEAPAENMYEVAKKAMADIWIEFKPGKRIAVKSKKQTGSLVPRGKLHEETVYGKIKKRICVPLKELKAEHLKNLADPALRTLLETKLAELKDSMVKLKKAEIFYKEKRLEKVDVFEEMFVVKYKLDQNFKVKDIESIIDKGAREAVKAHLAKHNDDPKLAFKDLKNNPVWLNEEKGISVKSVRCETGLGNLVPLHQSKEGRTFGGDKHNDTRTVDYVKTGNNHTLYLYRSNGEYNTHMVTFWDAFEAKQQGLPLHYFLKDGDELIESYTQNEMFVYAPDLEDITTLSRAEIAKRLYRVQKIAMSSQGAMNVCFRHQYETTVEETVMSKLLRKFIIIQSNKSLFILKRLHA